MKGMPVVVAALGLAITGSIALQPSGLDEDRAGEVEAVAPASWTPPQLVVALDEDRPEEDEPGWDCRIHGNLTCGVSIQGTWYVVQFKNGEPVAVWPREEIGG